MKKLGTTLLLALSLMSFTACGKKDNNNNMAYNCGGQYGYSSQQCAYGQPYGGQYGQQYGQPYGGQYGMCPAGSVQTQYGCLQQGPCNPGFGYHPTALNGGPGCVQGTTYGGGGYYGGGYTGGGYYGGGYGW